MCAHVTAADAAAAYAAVADAAAGGGLGAPEAHLLSITHHCVTS